MLKKKEDAAQKPADAGASVNLIGAGTTIKGDVISAGDIRIDGTLEGSVKTKGKVVVGSTGVVTGEVFSQNADVSGVIRGTVTVAELLSLKASSKLEGDILTAKLSIEPGAEFSGSCRMGAVVKDISNAERASGEAPFQEKTA